MTCIAAIIDKNKTYIAADSMGFDHSSRTRRKDHKIFMKHTSLNQPFMIGFTSSYRMGQILKYEFTPTGYSEDDKSEEDMHRYMVKSFVKEIKEIFKDNGYGSIKDGEDSRGGKFIVAIRDKLFLIESDFQVGIPLEKYTACGSGEDYALASLYTSERMHKAKYSPTDRLQLAVETAIEHCNTVGGDVYHLCMEHE